MRNCTKRRNRRHKPFKTCPSFITVFSFSKLVIALLLFQSETMHGGKSNAYKADKDSAITEPVADGTTQEVTGKLLLYYLTTFEHAI